SSHPYPSARVSRSCRLAVNPVFGIAPRIFTLPRLTCPTLCGQHEQIGWMSWPRVTEDTLASTTMAARPARATVHQARTRKASGSEEGVRIEKLRDDAVMEAATSSSGRILGP